MPTNNTVEAVGHGEIQDGQPESVAPARIWPLTQSAVNGLGWTAVTLAVVARAAVTLFGGFYWDDFTLQGRAARLPLDWSFLIYSHDGHVMPLGALLSWLTERAAPLEFWLPALIMIAGQAAVAILGWLLLRKIFGVRPLTLLPALIFLFSAMTLPGTVWWAAALNAIPMQLGMIGVTWGVWLIQRDGRERAGRIWIIASLVIALGFFEKSLLIGLWLVLAMWVLARRPSVIQFVKDQWKQRRWMWIILAAVAGGYVAFYVSVSDRGSGLPENMGSFFAALATAVFTASFPALIGGPVTWEPIGFGSALARPSGWIAILAFVAAVSLMVFAWRFVRRGFNAWVAAGIYLIVVSALMATTRLAATDPSIGMAGMRYTADALLPLVLAVGMSVMPIVGDKESEQLSRLRAGFSARKNRTTGWALVVLLIGAILATQSVSNFAAIWGRIPADSWLANARTTMAAGANDGAILDQQVPEFVIWGLAYPYSNASWALAPLSPRPDFALYTNNPRFIESNGKLVEGHIEGVTSRPGPVRDCGWSTDAGDVTIALTASIFEWQHRLQLDYLASKKTPGTVQLGTGTPVPVTFESGTRRMVVLVEGGGAQVTISGIDPGARICFGSATAGKWTSGNPFDH